MRDRIIGAVDENPPVFLIPSPRLGAITDVAPERVSSAHNEWMSLSREVLRKKREATAAGNLKPGVDVSDDHTFLRPFGAQFCPALLDLSSIGWVVKWPANGVFERTGPRAWRIDSSDEGQFYKFHQMSSFPEIGESDAVSIELGWIVVTPPGVSTLIKNVPNNLAGAKIGISIAEGVVRTDQAHVPIQVHALLLPSAKKIDVKRGEPLALLMPYRRERFEMHVMNDQQAIDDAARAAKTDQETFANAPGRYKELFVEGTNYSELYAKLAARVKA